MRMIILVACLWLATSPLWGKIAFYSKRDGNSEIYTMDSNGSDPTRLTFNAAKDNAPSWSPNARQIAFHSSRHDDNDPHTAEENTEIYIMDADGSNQRRLTHYPGLDTGPDWHPDGSQITFTSTRNAGENQNFNIFVIDADGSNVRQITDLEFAARPKWSPDGRRIAFEAFIGHSREIYVANADGTSRFQVSRPRLGADMFLGGWSPDGKRIVYMEAVDTSVAKSAPVIATLNLVGRRKVVGQRKVKQWDRVPVPRMPLNTVTFSADGKSLLFAGKRDNDWNIYRFRLADHALIQLTDTPGSDIAPHEWNPALSVSPQRLVPTRWGEIKSNLRHYRGIGRGSRVPVP